MSSQAKVKVKGFQPKHTRRLARRLEMHFKAKAYGRALNCAKSLKARGEEAVKLWNKFGPFHTTASDYLNCKDAAEVEVLIQKNQELADAQFKLRAEEVAAKEAAEKAKAAEKEGKKDN